MSRLGTRENYNVRLMEKYNYHNQSDIKELYRQYNNLYELGKCGDTVALSIWIDIKTAAFETNILTRKQKRYLVRHLINKETLREIGTEEELDFSTIRDHVNGAIKRIQKHLLEGKYHEQKNQKEKTKTATGDET